MRLEEIKNVLQVYADYLKKHFSVNNENDIDGVDSEDFWAQVLCKVKLPNFIRITDEECRFVHFDNIFETLGFYQKREGENVEGEIVLNKKCIENYALQLKDKGLVLKSTISPFPYEAYVYKIVLFHEFGHWMTHWMLDQDNKRWGDDFWEKTPDSIDLVEGLAQLFTYQAILIDSDFKNLKIIFETMLSGQTDPYQQHSTIMKHNKFSWITVFKALAEIRVVSNPSLDDFLNKFKH